MLAVTPFQLLILAKGKFCECLRGYASRNLHARVQDSLCLHVLPTVHSFVRSTTMDKWKDSELQKMKVRNFSQYVC